MYFSYEFPTASELTSPMCNVIVQQIVTITVHDQKFIIVRHTNVKEILRYSQAAKDSIFSYKQLLNSNSSLQNIV